MSAQTEADVKQLMRDMVQIQQNVAMLNNAMEAVIKELRGENNASVEGDDIVVKAASNGQATTKKAHR